MVFLLTNLLVKLFVKDSKNLKNSDVRTAYGNMSGIVGICLNLLLFAIKLLAGLFSGAISVLADAFNNLSDAGSSVVTFLGFKLANRPADDEHPYGHGRYEYVAGLGISIAIFIVGFELLKSSFLKIFSHNTNTSLNKISISILIISVIIKIWMFLFNKKLSKIISSKTLKATAMDSFTDSIATSVVLIGLIISKNFGVNVDGYLGCAVAFFILFTGFSTFKESLSPLIGKSPDVKFINEIRETVIANELITGVHDLLVHDYGANNCIISLHAEVPDTTNIVDAHNVADEVERILHQKFNCEATIHIDPVMSDELTVELRENVTNIVKSIDEKLSIHDFKAVECSDHTNVIFDLIIPHKYKLKDYEVLDVVKKGIFKFNSTLIPVIHIDKIYLNSDNFNI